MDDATTGAAPTGASDAAAEKRALRTELLAQRRALPTATIAGASSAVVASLRALPELGPGPRRVLLYAADADEVSLEPLLTDPPEGWEVLLPRVEGTTLALVPHRPGDALVVGYRGVREPAGPPVAPSSVDVAVVPGVAFTPDGRRLGRGAGLYDRTLPTLEGAVRVGVCAERFVRPTLPVAAHDATVDVVVTDASVRRRAAVAPDAPA